MPGTSLWVPRRARSSGAAGPGRPDPSTTTPPTRTLPRPVLSHPTRTTPKVNWDYWLVPIDAQQHALVWRDGACENARLWFVREGGLRFLIASTISDRWPLSIFNATVTHVYVWETSQLAHKLQRFDKFIMLRYLSQLQYICDKFLSYDPLCPSAGRSVCHNFLNGRRKVTLPCSYRTTCLIIILNFVVSVRPYRDEKWYLKHSLISHRYGCLVGLL